ncbi:MAG: TIGR04219 family outer membrane beta-barrel protein [Nitrospirota bacterium]
MKKAIIFIGVLFLLITPSVAGAIGFEAAIGAWNQDPEGYVSYKPITAVDQLDIDRDLKYDKETKVFGRLKVDMPLVLPNIYIMATPMKFESDKGQKDVTFSFGGQTFTASVPFTSKVQLDHYDIAFYYGVPFLKTATLGKLNAEIGINARIIDFKAEVNQPTTGLSASKSTTIPVPMVYVGVQLKPISLIAIEAEARGIAYSSNHYYDFIGRLKIKPAGPIFIAGGYRYEDIKIDYNDILSEVKIKGPFVEAGIEF